MRTKKLWQEVELVYGIRGEVVEIVYAEGAPAPPPPCYVVVRFDGYTEPDWSSGERYRGCIPISPVQSAWSSCGANGESNTMTRTQLPLKLCWALTIHKSQGQTLDKAVIDLDKREACTGLTFVCLSRAKQIDDLLVTAMPFDRIVRLGQSPVFQARRVEEVRLRCGWRYKLDSGWDSGRYRGWKFFTVVWDGATAIASISKTKAHHNIVFVFLFPNPG